MSEARDRWLAELYRASAQEQPSASVDRIVLAAARQTPRVRRGLIGWGVPLAAAAIVVVTVSLVIAVRDEPDYTVADAQPQAARERPVPPAADRQASTDTSTIPRLGEPQREHRPEWRDPAATDKSTRDERDSTPERPVRKSAAPRERGTREPMAPGGRPSPSVPAAPAEAPPPASAAAPAHPASAAPAPAAREALESAKTEAGGESERANQSADLASAPGALARRDAGSGQAHRQEMPEDRSSAQRWIEGILKLHAEGRLSEARESLASFRKRYPDYPLPEQLMRLRAED